MRPPRRYYFVFTHTVTEQTVKLLAMGPTPCAARNVAFGMLEELLKVDETLPRDNRWKLALQEDQGLV